MKVSKGILFFVINLIMKFINSIHNKNDYEKEYNKNKNNFLIKDIKLKEEENFFNKKVSKNLIEEIFKGK
jgi:hypothetical protein